MRCEICNKEIEKSSYHHAVLCGSECFEEHFWNEKISEYQKDDCVVVIDGSMYNIKNYSKKINGDIIRHRIVKRNKLNGFGGKEFKIRRNDGVIFEINDLWHNGFIPDKFKLLMPNNAEFINMEEK